MTKLEIYFRDLNKETKEEILKFFDYEQESDGNFEFVPLFVLEK